MKAVIDKVIAAGGIDTQRIYATGPSKQALQTFDLVCDTRTYSYFSAVAPLSLPISENTINGTGNGSQTTNPTFCPAMLGTDRLAGDGIGGAALSPPFTDVSMLFLAGSNDSLMCGASHLDCGETGYLNTLNQWVYSYPQLAGESNPNSSQGATGRPGGGSSVMFGAVMGCNGTPSSITTDTANGGNVTEKIYTGCSHSNRATGTVRVAGGGHSWPGLDQIDGYNSEQATWDFFAAYGGPSIGTASIPGDINGDGQVNVTDLSIMLSNWGTTNVSCDLNSNGTVDIFDLSILLTNFGT